MAGVPYMKQIVATVAGGTDAVVELPAPTRGTVKRLVIKEMNGGVADFTATLFTSSFAAGPHPESDPEAPPAPDPVPGSDESFDPLVFQITDVLLGVAGQYVNFTADFGYATHLPSGAGRTRGVLFLRLNSAGAGDKIYNIGYIIESPSLT